MWFCVNILLVALALDLRAVQHPDCGNRHPRDGRYHCRMAAAPLLTKARMMRVLVTGASGFVGRDLTQALSKAGYVVRAAARRPDPPSSLDVNIEPVALPDLSQPVDWRPLLRDIDAVVHLAGIAHVSNDIAEEQYDTDQPARDQIAGPGGIDDAKASSVSCLFRPFARRPAPHPIMS